MPLRRVALLAGAVLSAAMVAVAVPWALSGDVARRTSGDTVRVPGVRTGQRIGSAVQLVADNTAVTLDPGAAAAVARADEALSLNLLRTLDGNGEANLSVSPASLALALAMLQNGAVGTTRAQIQAVLHTTGMTNAAQNMGWQALASQWAAAAGKAGITLASPNSAWLQNGFPIRATFLSALRGYYGAGVWQADFAGQMSAALHDIDAWTKASTHGRIPTLFNDLDPATVLVLANAVYFKAAWAAPFDPSGTVPGAFTTRSGRTVTANFMSDHVATVPAAVTPDYQAVELPYRGGRFAALAIMPTGTLRDLVAASTPDTLDAIVSSLHSQRVSLSLPRFTTRSTLPLDHALKSMGMTRAYAADAQFGALSSQPLQVSQVLQRVYLDVGEKGTEATAATGVGVSATSLPVVGAAVRFDRPFLFLVRDTETGAILFAAQIADPTAA